MKLKPIFITSGVLLVLGVACAIVGAALNGGTIKNIEQENFEDKSHTFDNCREVTISDYDTDVEIISTNGEMRVDYTESDKVRYEISETDGRVGIKKKADLRLFDFSVVTEKRKLILYVPESYDGVLDISTSNSELTAEGISAGETKLDNSNGSITLTRMLSRGFRRLIIERKMRCYLLRRLRGGDRELKRRHHDRGADHVRKAQGRLVKRQYKARRDNREGAEGGNVERTDNRRNNLGPRKSGA